MDIMAANNTIFSGPLSVLITLWPGEAGERDIQAFFDEGYLDATPDGQSGVVFPVDVPVITCQANDVADVWLNGAQTPLDIAPKPEIGVPGGQYKVINKRPGGPGQVFLELEKRS